MKQFKTLIKKDVKIAILRALKGHASIYAVSVWLGMSRVTDISCIMHNREILLI